MKPTAEALRLQRLMTEDSAWALLRSDNIYFAATVLPVHLTPTAPRMSAELLFDRVDADLESLREDGFEISGDGKYHCTAWRNNGVLLRRAVATSREETYELTSDALRAFSFIEAIDQSRTSISHSRLATVQDRLRTIVRDTDPEVGTRIAALKAERASIDARIQKLESGELPPVDEAQASEDVADLLSLIADIPNDFTRVRTEVEAINRTLRESLITSEGFRGQVLTEVFRGVDLLAESDAGRSFSGFYSLILDPESSAELEANIEALLNREFSDTLTREEKNFLRALMPLMQARSQEVEQIMTGLTRSLRRFVQSEAFREERILNTEIGNAMAKAVETAKTVQPFHESGFALPQSSFSIASLASWRLHDPSDTRVETEISARPEAEPLAWDSLIEQSRSADIDMEELIGAVTSVLASGREAPSIAEVLADFPATQGVASVIGLLTLSSQYGFEESAADGVLPTEIVTWESGDGEVRSAVVPVRRFVSIPDASGRRMRKAAVPETAQGLKTERQGTD